MPDKSYYAALRSEHQGKLSDVKAQRDCQFKEKRIVDAELRGVNQEVQTKVWIKKSLKRILDFSFNLIFLNATTYNWSQ